jgi:hypothetical protein
MTWEKTASEPQKGENGGEGRTETEIQSGLEKIVAENVRAVKGRVSVLPVLRRNGGNTTEAYEVGG